jgi:hypothetical protein
VKKSEERGDAERAYEDREAPYELEGHRRILIGLPGQEG